VVSPDSPLRLNHGGLEHASQMNNGTGRINDSIPTLDLSASFALLLILFSFGPLSMPALQDNHRMLVFVILGTGHK
jgi:hypothetical protein